LFAEWLVFVLSQIEDMHLHKNKHEKE